MLKGAMNRPDVSLFEKSIATQEEASGICVSNLNPSEQ